MKALALAAFLIALPLPTLADGIGAFSDIIVFGDSYSDGGNAALATAGSPDPRPNPLLYPAGQFTNGDVWTTQLGLVPSLAGGTNYAFGGAEAVAEAGDVSPDLQAQIAAFLSSPPVLGPNPLPVIFIGANDFNEARSLAEAAVEAAMVLGAITRSVDTLLNSGLGINSVAVFGMFDLGRFPEVVNDPILGPTATFAANQFNIALRTSLATLFEPDETIFIDTFAVFEGIFRDPGALGLTNTTEACILTEIDPTLCRNDLGYFFVDNVHASEPVQEVLAAAFHDSLPAAAIPTPAAGLLFLSALGAAAALVRRRA